MRLVPISDLEKGDVLAKGIYTSEGVTLLEKGIELNSKYIKELRKLRIRRVYIEESGKDEEAKSKKAKFKEKEPPVPEKMKQEAVIMAKDCMEKVSESGRMEFSEGSQEEIINLVSEIIDEISEAEDLLYNLRDIRLLEDELFFHLSNALVLSLAMGRKLGYSESRLLTLGLGAFLHDIGKAKVPAGILNKPGKLTKAEFEEVKKHTIYGRKILNKIEGIPDRVARIAYEHHERCDGSGYPKGITKRYISEYSRGIAIVDVFDSMINERVYREALPVREVIEYLYTRFTKNKMDKELIKVFLEIVTPYPVGTKLKLSIGAEAVVIEVDENNKLRPIVRVLNMKGMEEEFEIDLSQNLYIGIEQVLN